MTTNSLLPAVTEEPLDEELLAEEEAAEEEAEEEEEEEQAPPAHDDSEELEMWMRQTRRAQLLTPGAGSFPRPPRSGRRPSSQANPDRIEP